jgi:hypothetical protein
MTPPGGKTMLCRPQRGVRSLTVCHPLASTTAPRTSADVTTSAETNPTRSLMTRSPTQHLGKYHHGTTGNPTLHQSLPRNDQQRSPLPPCQTIAAEPFEIHDIDESFGHPVAHQWTIRTRRRPREIESRRFQLVEELFRPRKVRTIRDFHGHDLFPVLREPRQQEAESGLGWAGSRMRCPYS